MLNSQMQKPAGEIGGAGERRDHMRPEQAWDRVKRRLRAELGEDVFSSWFARLEFAELREGTAYLTVPTRFLKSWIQSHYIEKVRALFVDECPEARQIAVGVRTGAQRPQPRAACQSDSAPAEAPPAPAAPERPRATSLPAFRLPTGDGDGLAGSPLDRRLTFATFLVGRSNALAHAAGERIARVPVGAAALYNPLYVHACVGLGKTHLLQAIAHEMLAAERRVIYLTADRFMYGFVAALKAQTALAFKERLRGIDLLVIDDVQFLQGKTIQQEFCHTINALIDAGKQVVIAADRQPADLESLDERIRSRLAGGLVVEMGALDEELRVKMLDNRIAAARTHQPGFEVSPAVVAYVARMIVTNGRDLEGAVNRLLAHMSLSGAPLTVEIAETAIRDLVRSREPKKVRIEDIQKLVATHYSVSRADILSSRRSASVVKPRQIAMYLAKQLTLRSLPEIGRRFGGRDHTTVLHAVRKIDAAVAGDPALKDEVDLLKRMLQD